MGLFTSSVTSQRAEVGVVVVRKNSWRQRNAITTKSLLVKFLKAFEGDSTVARACSVNTVPKFVSVSLP